MTVAMRLTGTVMVYRKDL